MPSPARQKSIVQKAARKYGIDPSVLWGLYGAETNFGKNKNTSGAGAQGPFQFMPGTARGMGIDPYNFRQAAFGAAKYLSQYKNRGVKGMLAAYNAGPAGDPNNPETRAYVPKVLELAKSWDGGGAAPGGAPGGSTSRTRTTTIPGVDNSQQRQQLKLLYLTQRGNPDALLQLAAGLKGAQDTPGQTVTTTVHGSPHDHVGNDAVAIMKAAAEKIDQAHVPYLWGGGHAGKQKRFGKVTALDCSGAVSRVLGIDPLVSGQLAKWGKPGKGKRVTIYANGEHTLMEIDGKVFGTSHQNPGGGAGWIPKSYFPKGYFSKFAVRHPQGM